MKALAIRRYKGRMEMTELPPPEVGPGDLLVRVRAASVNPVDYKIRDGAVKVLIPYSFPLILGNDLAGDVEAIGPGVTRFKVGDAVRDYPCAGKCSAASQATPSWVERVLLRELLRSAPVQCEPD
jgi:alcohol dehydrogenase